ncbi:MAG: cellulase family glycosylhydrolase [Oscillospiraceae bacterium]|nr:cellulase family glycosylhydrolase [Oscillospiraceae bacterium]
MKKRVFLFIFAAVMLMCSCAYGFSDVGEESWYYENVTEMTDYGYLSGYEDGTFRPSGIITKAELVSVVGRVYGLSEQSGASGHWADGMMSAALNGGWYDWDEIPPTGETYDEPITRQLAVKIVMNAFLPDERGDYNQVYGAVNDFSQLDGRYYDSVIAAYSCGVIYGDENGNINPKDSITRAEACAVIMRAAKLHGDLSVYEPTATAAPEETSAAEPVTARTGGVSENGRLHVEGTRLVNENGDAVVLHGMSSHGLQWFGNFATENAISATADYGANLFRCAMYTAEGGYISDKTVKEKLISAVDSAIRQDMYVIIDWHILSDGDPLTYADEAAEFFAEMSQRYADNPAVLYEICNEPNGNVTWDGNVKPYAERIIFAIRENSDGIILVGSPTWSQDLHEAAKNPLSGGNIMYTCHFYAGTHTDWLRQRIADCGLPVFVSEWGTSAADGNGGVYLDEAQKWIDFMNEYGISWANWSLCDKDESSAALVSGANAEDGISENELSESGKFVFNNF